MRVAITAGLSVVTERQWRIGLKGTGRDTCGQYRIKSRRQLFSRLGPWSNSEVTYYKIGKRRKEVVAITVSDSESDSESLCVEADGESWKRKVREPGEHRFHSS